MSIIVLSFALAFSIGPSQQGQPIRPGYFLVYPKAIDGCSASFTYDSIPLKRQKYIFATDMQDLAFVFVNGKQVTLKRTTQTALSETSRKEIFKGGGYTITLITKDVKALGEELTLEKGTLEIRHDKDVILVRVHGEAGC